MNPKKIRKESKNRILLGEVICIPNNFFQIMSCECDCDGRCKECRCKNRSSEDEVDKGRNVSGDSS